MVRDLLFHQSSHPYRAIAMGVGVGVVLVLSSYLSIANAPPLRFAVKLEGASVWHLLGCQDYPLGQCVNISVDFSGPTAINPSVLRISILPVNQSLVVNGTAGSAINLSFASNQFPELSGNLGGGIYVGPPDGAYINPDGRTVGLGEDSSIVSGATLCLVGWDQNSTEEYLISFSYGAAYESIAVSFP